MPTASKTQRETWQDWMPSEKATLKAALITRTELLERLNAAGVAVTERELRYWEAAGALPSPVRRFRNGATYALYPDFHTEVVTAATLLRREGRSLPEMRPIMQALFRELEDRSFEAWAEAEEMRLHRAKQAEANGLAEIPALPQYLLNALVRFAEETNETHRTDIEAFRLDVMQSGNRRFDYYLHLEKAARR